MNGPETEQAILGIDIGGANVKAATGTQATVALPFAMWRDWQSLHRCLARAATALDLPTPQALAITMTGELADCFASRAEGVAKILAHVQRAFPDSPAFIYAVNGQWLQPHQAILNPWDVAASNWHALASWLAAKDVLGISLDLLVDIGSTTVDVIPIKGPTVATSARTDRDRLIQKQLIYTGYERTPISAILSEVTVDGQCCPLMAERFADSSDAYLVLGLAREAPNDCDTADGRPRTRDCAAARIARMVGEDAQTLSSELCHSIAEQIVSAQASQIHAAIEHNLAKRSSNSNDARSTILFSGHGNALAKRISSMLSTDHYELLFLDDHLRSNASRCAPAVAVAELLASYSPPRLSIAPSSTGSPPDNAKPIQRRVVKLGGSLLDLPDLAQRIERWLQREPDRCLNLFVIGGGRLVDAIRDLDRIHSLDPAQIHWLCVELLEQTAKLFQKIAPDIPLIRTERELETLADRGARKTGSVIIPPRLFYSPSLRNSHLLPENWDTTTDSLAAMLAREMDADELILLKSTSLPKPLHCPNEWVEAGLVDGNFPNTCRGIPAIRTENLRNLRLVADGAFQGA